MNKRFPISIPDLTMFHKNLVKSQVNEYKYANSESMSPHCKSVVKSCMNELVMAQLKTIACTRFVKRSWIPKLIAKKFSNWYL